MMRGVLSTVIAGSAAVVLFFAYAVYQQKVQSLDVAETTQENWVVAARATEATTRVADNDGTLQQAAASIAPKAASERERPAAHEGEAPTDQASAVEAQSATAEYTLETTVNGPSQASSMSAATALASDHDAIIEQLQKVQQYLIDENLQLKDRIARLEQQVKGEIASVTRNPEGSVTVIDTGSRTSRVLNAGEYKKDARRPNGVNVSGRSGSQQLAGLKN